LLSAEKWEKKMEERGDKAEVSGFEKLFHGVDLTRPPLPA
jgi:hypothetical protein